MDKSHFHRDYGVELYRILLMFGIVLLHVTNQGNFSHVFPSNVLIPCVPGFVLITGFFGAKFRVSKVLKLYGIALWCLLLVPLIGGLWGDAYVSEVARLWRPKYGWWFLHAYVIMLVLTPAIDELLNEKTTRTKGKVVAFSIPFFLVVFGWGSLLNYQSLQHIVPVSKGLTAFSFLTLLGGYLVGRLIRFLELDKRIDLPIAGIGFLTCFILIAVTRKYFAAYNNPVSICMVLFLFIIFRHVTVPNWTRPVIEFLSPSLFSIFLMHVIVYFPGFVCGDYGSINMLMSKFMRMGLGFYLSSFIVAAVMFLACTILDLPRRLVVWRLRRFISWVMGAVDSAFIRFSNWCGRV